MAKSAEEDALIARLSSFFVPATSLRKDPERRDENLIAPEDVLDRAEPTLLKRKYLKALQEHATASRRFDELSRQEDSRNYGPAEERDQVDSSAILRSHLNLLRLRRIYSKAEIIARHASDLECEVEQQELLSDTRSANLTTASLDQSATDQAGSDLAELTGKAAILTKHLEVAVLRAQHQLRREKKLLNEVKERRVGQTAMPVSDAARLRAIAATRDELVKWMDERLSADEPHCEETESLFLSADSQAGAEPRAKQLYDEYLASRRRLLQLSSEALSPLPAVASAAVHTPSRSENHAAEAPGLTDFLPFIEVQLMPQLHQQNMNDVQHEFITSHLAKERSKTLEVLGRLGDESHLLHIGSESRESSLKPQISSARSAQSRGTTQSSVADDAVLRQVEAWRAAGVAASTSMARAIDSSVTQGDETVEVAENNLAELEYFLKQRQATLTRLNASTRSVR